jgi:dTMP kinase
MSGKLIVFEGTEGSGKSTQAELLLRYLKDRKIPVTLGREPGGTPLGERIREILLDVGGPRISPKAELFLYLAARAQLIREVIGPKLESGECVILDRYVHSTIAYQGYGLRVNLVGFDHAENITAMTELCRQGVGEFWPDTVFLLDLPIEDGLSRLQGSADRIEKRDKAFHKRVREGYLALAESEKDVFRVIDANSSAETTAERIRTEIELV